MNPKTALSSAKKSLSANRSRIVTVVAVVSTTVAVIQHVAIGQHNDFLRENGLFDAFYNSED